MKGWIEGVGPIITPTIISLQRDLVSLMVSNGNATNGGWKWMAIDGFSKMGKTYSVSVAALLVADDLCAKQADDAIAPYQHIPVVFIGAPTGPTVYARHILEKIAIFCGFSLPSRGGLTQATSKVRDYLINFGTLLIIVDDSHFIKRVNGSRDLTDNIKSLMTEIPVTWVFIGAGLRESALLRVPSEKVVSGSGQKGSSTHTPARYVAVEQLRLRMVWRPMTPERITDNGTPRQFNYFITQYINYLDRIPELTLAPLMKPEFLRALFKHSRGRPGVAVDLLRDICLELLKQPDIPTAEIVDRLVSADRTGPGNRSV